MRRATKQREKDLEETSRRYLCLHQTEARIAEDLGVSQSQISRDIGELVKRWRASSLANVEEAKTKELERLYQLEKEAWEAWSRSQEDAETRITRNGEKGSSEERRIEGRVGDPRFLDDVLKCIEQRRKILGLDAPDKHQIKEEPREIKLDLSNLPTDVLEFIAGLPVRGGPEDIGGEVVPSRPML